MKYLKKYKLFESKSNDQRIQLIKTGIKYNDNDDISINVYNELDISDALIYDDNNSTELRELYVDKLTYDDNDDETPGYEEYYGEYEKLSADTIDKIITAIKKLYAEGHWIYTDFILDDNKTEKDYNDYTMGISVYSGEIDKNKYPDTFKEYLLIQKTNDYDI